MHIPDGYISPQTSALFYLLSAPLWWVSLRKIRSGLKQRHIPLLAMLAAFSFLIMMFNIPLPGGTTGHAVGGVLVAILMGPWPALMAITVALAIQALFFGDGGLLAFGANTFNLAFIMPFAGLAAFKAAAGRSKPGSKRYSFAAAVGGYTGINIAALFVAIELGLQPVFHHLPNGTPLYCPYTISVTIPAMLLPHLSVGGLAEALVTGGVVAFLGRYHTELFEAVDPTSAGGHVEEQP